MINYDLEKQINNTTFELGREIGDLKVKMTVLEKELETKEK